MISVSDPRAAPLLPDILAPGLPLVFVGAAPSHWSAGIGHYYAGPTNRFWTLLHQAGFTPRRLDPREDASVLEYGIGLTGIYKHISTSANHLLPEPALEQREALNTRLARAAPAVVCYNGKDVYRLCTGRDCLNWGEQDDPTEHWRVFVVYSSSARADRWGSERLAVYEELRELAAREAQQLGLHHFLISGLAAR